MLITRRLCKGGARNFANYCLGCHSLKYERWSRLAKDLEIPEDLLQKDIMPPGDKPAQVRPDEHARRGCRGLVR